MIDPSTLQALETRVIAVLDGGPPDTLDVLGYGEISTVLRAEGIAGPVAAKRLPVMNRIHLDQYRRVMADYLATLEERGVVTVPSEVHWVGEDPAVPYCVQPLQRRLLVDELRTASPETSARFTDQLARIVAAAVDIRLGLDAQLSNWAIDDGQLVYYDVTTPFLRDGTGADRLDHDLFLASLPWVLRGLVRRFLLDEILSHYHNPRAVLLDAIGNLHKERLGHVQAPLLTATARVVDPPVTADEAARYYRTDARMWAFLQRLRLIDRWWQRSVRRRRYPFLLPGKMQR